MSPGGRRAWVVGDSEAALRSVGGIKDGLTMEASNGGVNESEAGEGEAKHRLGAAVEAVAEVNTWSRDAGVV